MWPCQGQKGPDDAEYPDVDFLVGQTGQLGEKEQEFNAEVECSVHEAFLCVGLLLHQGGANEASCWQVNGHSRISVTSQRKVVGLSPDQSLYALSKQNLL